MRGKGGPLLSIVCCRDLYVFLDARDWSMVLGITRGNANLEVSS